MPAKIPQQRYDEAVRYYLERPATIEETCEWSGISRAAFKGELKRQNIARAHKCINPERFSHPTYSLDRTFFQSIDSEEKAYWLGFVTADGSVSNAQLTLRISSKDRGHLELFKKDLRFEGPVKDFEPRLSTYGGKAIASGKMSSITISSVDIVRDLNKLGIHRNKSFSVEPWQGPSGLMSHYWRGVLDGDGWLYLDTRGYYVIGLCGNNHMVSAFADYASHIVKRSLKITPNNSILSCSIQGLGLLRPLVENLYGNSSVSLTRKSEVAEKILQDEKCLLPAQSIRGDIDILELRMEYDSGISTCKLAEKHQCSITTIRKKLMRSGCNFRRVGKSNIG
jgi:hypothetical protein